MNQKRVRLIVTTVCLALIAGSGCTDQRDPPAGSGPSPPTVRTQVGLAETFEVEVLVEYDGEFEERPIVEVYYSQDDPDRAGSGIAARGGVDPEGLVTLHLTGGRYMVVVAGVADGSSVTMSTNVCIWQGGGEEIKVPEVLSVHVRATPSCA